MGVPKGRIHWAARLCLLALLLVCALGCSNNPYPDADDEEKVLYLPFGQAPKTLDPAISYGTADSIVTNKTFDTLLEYHYFERPYRLLPSMAKELPQAEELEDGQVRYTFHLRPHIRFQPDECFRLSSGQTGVDQGRAVVAQDYVFELQRIADPGLTSPVVEPFSNLVGFREFRAALEKKRKSDKSFEARRIDKQYAEVSKFPGAVAPDDRTLIITLKKPYPQILYWFAMPFTTPVAWEAVQFYNGKEGRPPIAEHPISTGSFVVKEYDKQARVVLEKNPNWWGLKNPDAPGAKFPKPPAGAEWDDLRGAAGQQLPFLDRIEYRMEKEFIPQFNKFLQGYYDFSAINKESFDQVIQQGDLSPQMKEKGVRLDRGIEPSIFYLGFNMDDPTVGRAGGEQSRALRQAMSLAVDVQEYLRLFENNRGLVAQSIIPPGLYGYEESYKNPFRVYDLEKAKKILKDGGLENGIDPKTGKPIRLSFDVPDTSPAARVRFMFWVNGWRKLGINVELEATNYNQFYAKMKKSSHQIYTWGWMADYPDPENFLFLLTGPMARSVSGGPNNANFQNKEFDALFQQMETRPNDDERLRIIREMRKIMETERPWIELFHREAYKLSHGWVRNVRIPGLSTVPKAKFYDLDAAKRKAERQEWNQPVLWPFAVLVVVFLLVLAPGIATYYKERS